MLTNIFKNPEVLNRATHKDLKLSPYKNYEFAKDAFLVPLSLEEMVVATKSLIIVFIRDSEGNIFPSAVLGGEEGSNLLLNEDNTWRENRYIPATLRCYPFGISSGKENFITVDTEAEVFSAEGGNLIIKDEQNMTKEGDGAVKFVTEVYSKVNEAKKFTSFIDSLGILKQAEISIQIGDDKHSVKNGIYIIDENSLNKLESRKLKKLATGGYLGFIYAHLLSLNNRY